MSDLIIGFLVLFCANDKEYFDTSKPQIRNGEELKVLIILSENYC